MQCATVLYCSPLFFAAARPYLANTTLPDSDGVILSMPAHRIVRGASLKPHAGKIRNGPFQRVRISGQFPYFLRLRFPC